MSRVYLYWAEERADVCVYSSEICPCNLKALLAHSCRYCVYPSGSHKYLFLGCSVDALRMSTDSMA